MHSISVVTIVFIPSNIPYLEPNTTLMNKRRNRTPTKQGLLLKKPKIHSLFSQNTKGTFEVAAFPHPFTMIHANMVIMIKGPLQPPPAGIFFEGSIPWYHYHS